MSEAAKDRFRSLIDNELARGGREDRGALEAVLAKLDASVDSLIAVKGLDDTQARGLRAALAEVKAERLAQAAGGADTRKGPPEAIAQQARPNVAQPVAPEPRRRSFKPWIGGGLAAAAIIGAVLATPDIAAALQANPAKPEAHLASFQARLDASAASVEAVTKYLRKVGKAVEGRQKADPVALTALAGSGWVSLKSFDPKLYAEKPKQLSRKTEIKLRAAGTGYKVLLRSPLCTDAKYVKPGFVDPKRDPKTAGCEYLAVWNKAGAGF